MKLVNPIAAIRAKCLDCTVGQCAEVRLCSIEDCPLHPYRMGVNPNTKRKGNKLNFKLSDRPPIRNHPREEIVKKSPDREPIFTKESILEGELE